MRNISSVLYKSSHLWCSVTATQNRQMALVTKAKQNEMKQRPEQLRMEMQEMW